MGLSRLTGNLAHNNVDKLNIHRCALPAVVDLTGQLTDKEKEFLENGLKFVSLSKTEKEEALVTVCQQVGATATLNPDRSIAIRFEPQVKQRLSLGYCWGLREQRLILPADPARQVIIPPLHNDQQITRLRDLRNIGVFKKADKGSTMVFMAKSTYSEAALRHLQTDNYAVATETDPDGSTDMVDLFRRIGETGPPSCQAMIAGVDLTPERIRHIYFLPKLHKPIDSFGFYPVRPITDCFKTALAAADKVASSFLSALYKVMSTIAPNSINVVASINNLDTSGFDAVLYAADVWQLYTSLPIDETINRVAALLDEFEIGDSQQRALVISILKIALHNNLFYFSGQRYRQVHGIAMGSNSAPVVADAFMFSIERELVKAAPGLLLFRRYRDDIFGVFTDETAAHRFDANYKGLHRNIIIESSTSREFVNFLDIRVSKFPEDGSLRTGVYFKPTNALPLLHAKSNHPRSVLIGAIQGRLLNFIRICNNRSDLWQAIFSLAISATKYGYSEIDVFEAAETVIDRCQHRQWPYLSSKRDRQRDYRTPLVSTFVRNLQPIYNVARRRRTKLSHREGSCTLKRLCRTKDC